ncbi:MAG: serine hydroxymethyltransferase, partial [Firmicutes bacterium]|nr:serine hydroxymethyltransferase [Bacillota bacterium]
ADVVTTTSHKTLRGPRGGIIMCREELASKIDKAIFPGTQGGPLMHCIAAKAVCLQEALQPSFRTYQQQIVNNARALAQVLSDGGLRLVSGGTDNHLMLVDLTAKGRTGLEVEQLLDRANITVNKNAIPNDKLSPTVTSGLRIGTPAVTSRGLTEADMTAVGRCIVRIIDEGEAAVDAVREDVLALCRNYPLYS